MTHQPVRTSPMPELGGHQYIYRFPNGYGASLVNHRYACGGRELAVLRFRSERISDFDLAYDTPITDDVLGHLGEDDVEPLLDRIAALPNPAEVSA